MKEGGQRRRCRGQKVLGKVDILQKAPSSIPRALATTDARVVHGAAEAWQVSFTLEYGALWLSFCRRPNSLCVGAEIPANESHKVALRHSCVAQVELSTTKARIHQVLQRCLGPAPPGQSGQRGQRPRPGRVRSNRSTRSRAHACRTGDTACSASIPSLLVDAPPVKPCSASGNTGGGGGGGHLIPKSPPTHHFFFS